ncbi:MAG: Scr1 family TA system antitoxin-like transcriptional regulator [Sciscionella sp.]
MPPSSSTVASWELALRLRQRRDQLGIDVRTITAALGFSRNYWSAVENERKVLSEDKLASVLKLLEFDEDERGELLELRETAKQRGWWGRYSALFIEDTLRLYGLEHGAQAIRTYESLLIPGLLQTEEYARALMTSEITTIRQVEVDQRIEVRLRRQERITGEDPLHLTAIVSQAALRQQTGGPQVLRDQLNHLASVVEEYPDVLDLRIIPFTATGCGAFGASTFHLIDFASTRLPTLAWQETVTAAGIIDEETQVRDLNLTYTEALARTLNAQDSLGLIKQHISEV